MSLMEQERPPGGANNLRGHYMRVIVWVAAPAGMALLAAADGQLGSGCLQVRGPLAHEVAAFGVGVASDVSLLG